MVAELGAFALVFVAGLITDLATGLGAIPFYVVDEIHERVNVVLWGVASGIMVSASVFGLLREGLQYGTPFEVGAGALVGVLLVVVSHHVITESELDPREYEQADFDKLVLILGILTVHSFPEGVAIGVSFAELGFAGGIPLLGFSVPLLAIVMTLAISIHNIPEGVATSIPLNAMGVPRRRLVGWAIFSSLPQPIGAVLAFGFVRVARAFLPAGFGFAAGAMIYLVATEFLPEALEEGRGLPGNGRRELVAGFLAGLAVMTPLVFI